MTGVSGRVVPTGLSSASPIEPHSRLAASRINPSRLASIAELKELRLSDGQKRALLGLPAHRDFRPEYTGFRWPTLACLKSKRLINSVADGLAGCGPKAMHRITDRGHRVRALLESMR